MFKKFWKKKKKADAPKILIWDTMSGVLLPEDIGQDPNFEGEVYVKVKLEVSGEMTDTYLSVEGADQALELIKHFRTNIEPIEVQVG